MSKETLSFRGVLVGHSDWVTAIATPVETSSNIIISASRDKTVMVWEIDSQAERFSEDNEPRVGVAKRSLRGHNHFVQDVVLSLDAQYCLSGSWDSTLRLWDLKTGHCSRTFTGHTKDVLSVAFSVDNRQIVSGSRDKTIRLWNTLGDCKFTWGATEDGHKDWVSCVRFSPNPTNPVIVSGGWDKQIKVWTLTPKTQLLHNLVGHSGYINAVTVSPDGSLCASGGKDCTTMLWDLNEGKRLYLLEAGDVIHALCFSPMRYWLVAATQRCIKVWDLESKSIVEEVQPDLMSDSASKKAQVPYCVSLAWSADGSTLYAGYTNGKIYSYVVDII